jgi:hypothetical protein
MSAETVPQAASQKMLVTSDPHETRIAVLEDDRLTEIFVERHRHRGIVGNVYKGRVTRVLHRRDFVSCSDLYRSVGRRSCSAQR